LLCQFYKNFLFLNSLFANIIMGLDEYKVGKAAGRGKFSTVYRAKRLSDDCTVALKKIDVGTFVLFIGLSDWIVMVWIISFSNQKSFLICYIFIYVPILFINVIYCFLLYLLLFFNIRCNESRRS